MHAYIHLISLLPWIYRLTSATTGNPCDDKIQGRINELLKGITTVRHLKLALIGTGGVGTTSLIERLSGHGTDEEAKGTMLSKEPESAERERGRVQTQVQVDSRILT